ncbi:chromosome partitioning protein ParB [Spirochaetia bacterium]|nr:chromosome partitioning protein ParB [Spirochaetia bacterium]
MASRNSAKSRLGKGLDALLPREDLLPRDRADEDAAPGQSRGGAPGNSGAGFGGEILLSLDKLAANPSQPRKHFDEEALQELADSIGEHGIIQPIIVDDRGNGSYIIVAGERRSRAARLAGLTEVPVLVRNYSDEKRMEVALIENVQREDLNPMEEAAAYKRLMDLSGLSQDQAAAKVGKNRSTVANALRLLKLPSHIQESLESGALSPGHARAILSVTKPADQETLFREITARGLSVREAEKRAAALNPAKTREGGNASGPAKRDPELAAMEQKFIEALGTKVSINGGLEKGKIEIDYYSMDDLDRLYGLLGN